MSNSSLVSVIIPTHNRANLLKRSINSVLSQTYTNLELIVVDDFSSDETASVVNDFMQKDERVRYLKNELNLGGNITRNKGILAAKGEFITLLDDDDEFLDDRLEMLVASYDDRYSFVLSDSIYLEPDRNVQSKNPKFITMQYMLLDNRISNSIMTTKDKFIKAGLFDETLPAFQDHEMWLRLIAHFGNALNVDKTTHIIHWEFEGARVSKSPKRHKAYFMVYNRYKKYMDRYTRGFHLNRMLHSKRVLTDEAHKYQDMPIKFLQNKLIKQNIKKLSIYGAGGFFDGIYPFLCQNNIEIEYIIDTKLAGQSRYGHKIINLKEFAKIDRGFMLIASGSFHYEIKQAVQSVCKNTHIIEPY